MKISSDNIKKIALMGVLTSFALIMGYIEFLIPFNFGVPGIKLGLGNIVIILALYLFGKKEAFVLLVLKVVLSGLLFSGVFAMLYSFAGGILSYVISILFYRMKNISMVGVSILSAVFHNVGQILLACFLLENLKIMYILPVLLFAAVITGALIGILAKLVFNTFEKTKFFN